MCVSVFVIARKIQCVKDGSCVLVRIKTIKREELRKQNTVEMEKISKGSGTE